MNKEGLTGREGPTNKNSPTSNGGSTIKNGPTIKDGKPTGHEKVTTWHVRQESIAIPTQILEL